MFQNMTATSYYENCKLKKNAWEAEVRKSPYMLLRARAGENCEKNEHKDPAGCGICY